MVLIGACQLADDEVMDMIRAPATRAIFAERAARLDQLGALLISQICILRAHATPGSAIVYALYTIAQVGGRTRLAVIVPILVDRVEVDLAQGGQ